MSQHEVPCRSVRERLRDYPSQGDQLGAFAKILGAILPHLSAEALATIPDDAWAVLEQIEVVKARYPKPQAD